MKISPFHINLSIGIAVVLDSFMQIFLGEAILYQNSVYSGSYSLSTSSSVMQAYRLLMQHLIVSQGFRDGTLLLT